jgi:hypothetical protein
LFHGVCSRRNYWPYELRRSKLGRGFVIRRPTSKVAEVTAMALFSIKCLLSWNLVILFLNLVGTCLIQLDVRNGNKLGMSPGPFALAGPKIIINPFPSRYCIRHYFSQGPSRRHMVGWRPTSADIKARQATLTGDRAGVDSPPTFPNSLQETLAGGDMSTWPGWGH